MKEDQDTHAAGRSPSVFDRAFLTGADNVTEVILVRHGQQRIEREATTGELIDPPLTEQGKQQARLVGEALSTLNVDAVYASYLQRAFETARAIAGHHRLEPVVVDDLREVEIFRDVPPEETPLAFVGRELLEAARRRMLTEKSWDVYPLSEPSHEFRKRTINAIESIIAAHQSGRIVIACHGGVINAYVGHIIGSRFDMFFRPAHASVSIVDAGDDRRVLRLLNDTHHLRTSEGDFASY
jgi:broad specificity phosphatase PhoE